jgi:hypothetical protein
MRHGSRWMGLNADAVEAQEKVEKAKTEEVDEHDTGEGDEEEEEGGGEIAEENWWRSDNISTEEAAVSVAVAQADRPLDANVFGDAHSAQRFETGTE